MSSYNQSQSDNHAETPEWLIGNVRRLSALGTDQRLNEECELLYDWLRLDRNEINMRKEAEREVLESCKSALVDIDIKFVGSSVTHCYLPDSDINLIFFTNNITRDFEKIKTALIDDEICTEFLTEPSSEQPYLKFLHGNTGIEITVEAQCDKLDISQTAFISYSIQKFKYFRPLSVLLKYLLKINGYADCIEKERSFLFYLLIVYYLYQNTENRPIENACLGTLFTNFFYFYGKEVHILGANGYLHNKHPGALNLEGNYALQQFLSSIEMQLKTHFYIEQNQEYIYRYIDFFAATWDKLIFHLKKSHSKEMILVYLYPLVPRISNSMRLSQYYHNYFPSMPITKSKKRTVKKYTYYQLNPVFIILCIFFILVALFLLFISIVREDVYTDTYTY